MISSAYIDAYATGLMSSEDADAVKKAVWEHCEHGISHLDAEEHYRKCHICIGQYAIEALDILAGGYNAVRAK